MGVISSTKPDAWTLSPQMTAAPEYWRGNTVIVIPFWNDRDKDIANGFGLDYTGSPSRILNQNGSVLDFNGSSDYIEIQNSKDKFLNSFSFAIRVKSGYLLDDQRILARWASDGTESFVLWMDSGGAGAGYAIQIKESTDSPIATIGTDASSAKKEMQSVVAVYDLNTILIYVDGVKKDQAPATVPVKSSNNNIRIGNLEGVGQFFNGKIEMAVLSSRPWTEKEVIQWSNDPFAMLRPAGI